MTDTDDPHFKARQDDPYFKTFEDGPRKIRALFAEISAQIGNDETKRMFEDALRRPQGKRTTNKNKQRDDWILALLTHCSNMDRKSLAEELASSWHYKFDEDENPAETLTPNRPPGVLPNQKNLYGEWEYDDPEYNDTAVDEDGESGRDRVIKYMLDRIKKVVREHKLQRKQKTKQSAALPVVKAPKL